MAYAVLIVAVVMCTITVVTLTSIGMGTSYALKKRGYHPNQIRETYDELKTNLRQIAADVEETRGHIADLIILYHDRQTKTP